MAEINDLSTTDASNTARFPENQLPSTVNDGARALEGLIARSYRDTRGSLTPSGSSNTWTITPAQTISSLYDGLQFVVEAPSSPSSSLRVIVTGSTAAGAKLARFGSTEPVRSGDIRAGQRVALSYDGTSSNWKIYSGSRPVKYATIAETNTGTAADRAVTPAGLLQSINGMTTATSIVTTGLIPFYLPTSSAPRKITYLNALNSFNSLTESTAPALSSDFLLMYSAGSSASRKVKPSNIAAIAATQAQFEAATATNVYSSPGRQQFHPGHPKAVVVFQSRVTNGACTINSAFNVTDVSRTALGQYTITFSTAFSAANYVVVVSPHHASLPASPFSAFVVSRATGTCVVGWQAGASPGYGDGFDFMSVICMGDQ